MIVHAIGSTQPLANMRSNTSAAIAPIISRNDTLYPPLLSMRAYSNPANTNTTNRQRSKAMPPSHAKAKKGEIPFVAIGFGSHRPRRRYDYDAVLKALAGGNGGER